MCARWILIWLAIGPTEDMSPLAPDFDPRPQPRTGTSGQAATEINDSDIADLG